MKLVSAGRDSPIAAAAVAAHVDAVVGGGGGKPGTTHTRRSIFISVAVPRARSRRSGGRAV